MGNKKIKKFIKYLLIAGLLVTNGLVFSACSIDTGSSSTGACDRSLTMTGTVANTDISATDYEIQSVWFNQSLDEIILTELDEEMMERVGLDSDDQEDIARYKYFTYAYDLRFLFIQQLSETEYGVVGADIGKDFSVYFFDLEEFETQPGTSLSIFDISSVVGPRDSGDLDLLGDTIRELVDTMQTNEQPDVLVAFAPDRSEEDDIESAFINLFSTHSQFATTGTASFHTIYDTAGNLLSELFYPYSDFDTMSLTLDGTFDEGEEANVEGDCIGVEVSE